MAQSSSSTRHHGQGSAQQNKEGVSHNQAVSKQRHRPSCWGLPRLLPMPATSTSPVAHRGTSFYPYPSTICRTAVSKAPVTLAEEERKHELMAAVLAAPRPSAGEGGAEAPADMEGLQQGGNGGGEGVMAVDGEGGGGTSTNPSKLLKKLRKQRLAVNKGIVKGQKKKAQPLAGANQFHKKSKKKRK